MRKVGSEVDCLSFNPEFRVVAACCRWPRSVERSATIRREAAGALDWSLVARIAARHRVAALVADGIACADLRPPKPIADHLASSALQALRTALAMAAETVRLQCAFDAAGCPVTVLKGAPLALLAYGDIGMKSAVDIDLLILPKSARDARTILEAEGYQFAQPVDDWLFHQMLRIDKECPLYHPGRRVTVDLHWHLVDNPLLLPRIDAHSPTQAVTIGDADVRQLAEPALTAYLMVHGTRHGWSRLKWLADVTALLATLDDDALCAHIEAVQRLGTGRAAAVTLLLAHQLLGLAVKPSLLAKIVSDRTVVALANTATSLLSFGGGAQELNRMQHYRILLGNLRLVQGLGYARHELWNWWECSIDRLNLRLPPRLDWLYHVLRIPLSMHRLAQKFIARTR